ncbi:glycolate oxidase subunit GlcF [Nonomuraea roseoviolacea subsp. roseoviolacea]|uniref:Glycolate oxidase iron-sulfur subunit n=1 Tax=Nonomuraea roseoviolacea subsp. carminata TaxID=160689 RepID=A0ABT1JSD9_9ACTN|nr:(Fe-S)-binding protein [Nonomuraea roseoviolacea]MCP2344244.1 glycolate oxidase iron-sulfur subunit [Nonomuraea roseoviolacea subsp. carminata]
MTGFTPDLLNRCIACGFCLPACPTYALTKDETSSPRGRIDLMRALDEGTLPADDPRVREEASFCLGCRACETVCPAGVQYGDLLEEWRDQQWQGSGRPLVARLLMILVDARWRVRLLGLLRRHARTRGGRPEGPSLMLGCFERALFPKVSRAARRLFPELAAPAAQGCCGALHAHNGDSARGRRMAEELGRRLPGTIVTTSGGCAAHLSSVLGRDRVKELSRYAYERDMPGGAEPSRPAAETPPGGVPAETADRPRVALQDSCHLRNGLDVWREPRAMLERIGTYVELPSAGTCCGAAGTYALVRPRDSRRVLDAKLDEIEAAGVDYVAVVNPGCYRQLDQGLRRRKSRVRAVHLAELLAGERPRRREP